MFEMRTTCSGRGRVMRVLPALLCLALAAAAAAHEGEVPPVAPERPDSLFEPPEPGSYALPAIRRVAEHQMVSVKNLPAPLLGLEEGQVALVSFIYRNCSDAAGCPAVLSMLRRIDREIARDPALAKRTRLVTVSFDPHRDTAKKMAELRGLLEPRGDWRFLTTHNEVHIEQVLGDFDQDVLLLATEDGEAPVFAHLVKLFLVDAEGYVRNIYSSSLFDWRLVLNDIRTLTE